MKTYIKPYIYCTLVSEDCHILAGSDPKSPNQATDKGVTVPGYSQEYDGSGDGNNNVDEMAKPYNPWTSWDDFDL